MADAKAKQKRTHHDQYRASIRDARERVKAAGIEFPLSRNAPIYLEGFLSVRAG